MIIINFNNNGPWIRPRRPKLILGSVGPQTLGEGSFLSPFIFAVKRPRETAQAKRERSSQVVRFWLQSDLSLPVTGERQRKKVQKRQRRVRVRKDRGPKNEMTYSDVKFCEIDHRNQMQKIIDPTREQKILP